MKRPARLIALLVLLAATAGLVMLVAPPGPPPLPGIAPRAARRPPAAKSRTDTVEAWEADILARPLIYPGRRAPAPAAAVADATAPPPPPRLTGVIISPSSRRALFASNPGARPVAVQEGERIGPYLIRSIHADEVVVDGPGGVQSLRPAYEDRPSPAMPAPQPPQQHAGTNHRRFTRLV